MSKWIAALGVIILFATAVAAYNGVNMRTYTKYADASTPATGDLEFTAYYNGDDSYIQTEDSYNQLSSAYGTNPNTGWYNTIGYNRNNTDQFSSVTIGTPYDIWVSGVSKNEGGHATGSVTGTNPTFTTPGTSASPLTLAGANFLAKPSNFTVRAGNGEAFIRWDAVTGATGYRVYRGPVPANSNLVFQKVASPTTNYVIDTGLSNGTTYWYTVVAVTASTRSGHPTEVSASPSAVSITVTGPASGTVSQSLTITGSNFGASNTVYINGYLQTASWNGSSAITIDANTPTGAGKLVVIRNDNNNEDSIDFTANGADTTKPTSGVTIANTVYGTSTWNQSNTINGTASDNVSVSKVEVSIQRSSDSQYWNGSTWQAGIAWNLASGTNSWTYSFAAANMGNGITYTVQSRATDTSSNVQDPPYNSDSYSWDSQGPTMTFNPTNGSNNVPTSQSIVITFSEAMNTSSLTYNVNPNPGGLSVAWSGGNTVATISHTAFNTSTSYTVTVTAATDVAGNSYTGANATTFTTAAIPGPSISSITWKTDTADNIKNKNYVYGTIEIQGTNFGADPGNGSRDTAQNKVTIGSVVVPDVNPDGGIEVYYWSDTAIVAGVPLMDQFGAFTIAGDLPVTVTAGSQASNSDKTILVNPKVYGVNPVSGEVGSNVTITGTAFGSNTANVSVSFSGIGATPTSLSGNTTLEVKVPTGAVTGQLLVTVNGKTSNANYDWGSYEQITYNVNGTVNPRVTSVTPTGAEQGQTLNITITGADVAWSGNMASAVHFSGSGITVNSATGNSSTITANITVATSAAIGDQSITVDGATGFATFTVTVPGVNPVITAIVPSARPAGTNITINGLRFGSDQSLGGVYFVNTVTKASYSPAINSWSAETIEAIVPRADAGTYEVRVVRMEIASGTIKAYSSDPASFQITDIGTAGIAKIFPNPFNPNAGEIAYISASEARGVANVGFYIFDMTARLVHREVISSDNTTWNGIDTNGMMVGDGAYILRVINEDTKTLLARGKILVVKR
jgi:hypothetical protein